MRLIKLFYDAVDDEGNIEYGCTDSDLSDRAALDMSAKEPCPLNNIVNIEPDEEEGETAVDLAVRFLQDHRIVEPSSYPHWHPNTWYTSIDPEREDGTEIRYSAHLYGFTPDEERAIYEKLKKRW